VAGFVVLAETEPGVGIMVCLDAHLMAGPGGPDGPDDANGTTDDRGAGGTGGWSFGLAVGVGGLAAVGGCCRRDPHKHRTIFRRWKGVDCTEVRGNRSVGRRIRQFMYKIRLLDRPDAR